MKTLCFMFVLGLLIAGPSFNTFALITQNIGVSKGQVVHFIVAGGRVMPPPAPSHHHP